MRRKSKGLIRGGTVSKGYAMQSSGAESCRAVMRCGMDAHGNDTDWNSIGSIGMKGVGDE